MATHTGVEGVVKVGSVTVAEVTGFEFTESAQTIDDSTLADAADTFLAGSTSWNGSLSCWWDETDTTGQGALTIGASVTLNLYPEGATAADKYYSGTAIITGITRRVARNAIITQDFTYQGSGALALSTAS
jgi:hypothetical protein